jgi:hypothetical protein
MESRAPSKQESSTKCRTWYSEGSFGLELKIGSSREGTSKLDRRKIPMWHKKPMSFSQTVGFRLSSTVNSQHNAKQNQVVQDPFRRCTKSGSMTQMYEYEQIKAL